VQQLRKSHRAAQKSLEFVDNSKNRPLKIYSCRVYDSEKEQTFLE
jgi:hypothetical protein